MGGDRRRLNLSLSMQAPQQREAWKILRAIPPGQRTDAMCRMVCRAREQDQLLDAVRSVNADTVFVLPNNKNIILAAEQAVHLSEEKKIVVVPTKTIPQGISAMLAVDPDEEDEKLLVQAMRDAAAHVRSGQVTYAARDSEFDGKKIKQGEYLSLSEGKLCASGREASVIKKLVREMVSDDSAFATVIYGEGVSAEQAADVEALLRKENKELEISVIDGGQPVYYYIISVE